MLYKETSLEHDVFVPIFEIYYKKLVHEITRTKIIDIVNEIRTKFPFYRNTTPETMALAYYITTPRILTGNKEKDNNFILSKVDLVYDKLEQNIDRRLLLIDIYRYYERLIKPL